MGEWYPMGRYHYLPYWYHYPTLWVLLPYPRIPYLRGNLSTPLNMSKLTTRSNVMLFGNKQNLKKHATDLRREGSFLYSHRYSRVNILFLLRLRNQFFVFCEKSLCLKLYIMFKKRN